MGRTPLARRRRVQRGPEPIVHLSERIRTTRPSREVLETRRTKSPVVPSKVEEDEAERTIIVRSREAAVGGGRLLRRPALGKWS